MQLREGRNKKKEYLVVQGFSGLSGGGRAAIGQDARHALRGYPQGRRLLRHGEALPLLAAEVSPARFAAAVTVRASPAAYMMPSCPWLLEEFSCDLI